MAGGALTGRGIDVAGHPRAAAYNYTQGVVQADEGVMRRPQYSVAGLLAAVTFVAVACGSLAKPSPWSASALVTFTVATAMAFGIYASIGRGPRRTYAAGFAAVAALYLLLVFGPGFSRTIGPWLLTSKALSAAESKWHPESDGEVFSVVYPANDLIFDVSGVNTVSPGVAIADFDVDGDLDLVVGRRQVVGSPRFFRSGGNGLWTAAALYPAPSASAFQTSGQMLWTWLIAAAGGWAASRWHARHAVPSAVERGGSSA
jgi:hypothetical protein